METKTTLLKTGLLALFLFLTNAAFALTYVCKNATFSITPTAAPAGMVYRYDVIKDGNTTTPFATNLTTAPTSFAAGGSYQITVRTIVDPATPNPSLCPPPDASTTIVVLDPSITLASTTSSYCLSASTKESTITPTTGGWLPAYGADLKLVYTYTVSHSTTGNIADITTVGEFTASTGVYKLTTTTPGTYTITAKVKYEHLLVANTPNPLLGTGCETPTTTTVITVTTAPSAPTITVGS